MFYLSKPSDREVERFLERAKLSDLTYTNVGATAAGPTANHAHAPHFAVDHNEIVIGKGPADFERAKNALREWRMFDLPWVELCWTQTPIEKDRIVAIRIWHFGFYSLNAARIVYTFDKPEEFGFAYGTLREHGESGEERFSVRIESETGNVIYDLYAFSRPNYLSAQLAYPLTRMLQKRFATDSKAAMLRAIETFR